MIDDPAPPPRARRARDPRGPDRPWAVAPMSVREVGANAPAATDGLPPAPPLPPLDEWDVGEVELGWGAVAPDAAGQGHAGSPRHPLPSTAVSDPERDPATGQVSDARPLLLRVLRPWFEPRPGELHGAIVLLSLALVGSLALWFDATRRPVATAVVPVPSAPADAPAGSRGAVGARADGSDGWGLAPAPGPVVHVSGAVREPGVVTLPERSRVADAIAAVGGAMPDARLDALNLARVLEDGERVHVPRVGEDAPPPQEPASRGVLPDGRIDLNAASPAELETLPGVGPARARAIIAEREARPFKAPGDLRRVPGIGEATFQRLAPFVAVR